MEYFNSRNPLFHGQTYQLANENQLAQIKPNSNPYYDGSGMLYIDERHDDIYHKLGEGLPQSGLGSSYRQSSDYINSLYNQSTKHQTSSDSEVANSVFFESPSKYVSVKKYNQTYFLTNPAQNKGKQYSSINNQQSSNFFMSTAPEKGLSISKWFSGLSLPDKSVVLTTVDKKLVGLIEQMYNLYKERGNGKFTVGKYPVRHEIEDYVRTKHYELLFKIPYSKGKREYTSQTVKQIQEAEESIISAIRIISINEENDAFTLEFDFYKNTTYFLEIMNIASNKHFFFKELQIVKDSKKLAQSVLDKANNTFYDSKPYFTCIPFNGDKTLPQQYTLGQMLIFLIEKMINVQYHDYLNKLTQQQHNFFFTEPVNNIFQNDQKLTNYWVSLADNRREQFFKQITDIQNQLITEEHLNKSQCSQITEEDNAANEYSPKNEFYSSDADDNYQNNKNYKSYKKGSDSDYDLEDQRPYNKKEQTDNNTYFLGNEWNKRNDTKYAKQKSKNQQHYSAKPITPLIGHDNELFSNSHNQFFSSKMSIFTAGKEARTQELVYHFIKKISTSVSLYIFVSQKLVVKYYQLIYDKLLKQCDQSIIADLMAYENPNTTLSITSQSQQNQNQSQSQNQQSQSSKKNKKKKKKNASAVVTNQQNDTVSIPPPPQNQNNISNKHAQLAAKLVQSSIFEAQRSLSLDEEVSQIKKHLEERTSLLTGELLLDKYAKQENNYNDQLKSPQNGIQVVASETKKKKKRKKNKTNHDKAAASKIDNEQSTIEQMKLATQVPQAEDTIDDLESISLDHIQLIEPDESEEPLNTDRKINNFIINNIDQQNIIDQQNGLQNMNSIKQTTQLYNNDQTQKKEEDEDEEEMKSVVIEVAAQLCNQTIMNVKDKDQKKKKPKKNNKKDQQAEKIDSIVNQKELKLNSSSIQRNEKISKSKQKEKNATENNQQQDQLQTQPQQNNVQKAKKVGFIITKELSEEELNVPKRNSSRGSSGTEDVIHSNTICQLEGLFANHYEDPSENAKSIISVITKQREDTPPPKSNSYVNNIKPYPQKAGHQTSRKYEYKKEEQLVYQKKTKLSQKVDASHSTQNQEPSVQKYKNSYSNAELNKQVKYQQKSVKSATKQQPQQQFNDYESMFQQAFDNNQDKKQQQLDMVAKNVQVNNDVQKPHKESKKSKKKRQLLEKGVSVNPETLKKAHKTHQKLQAQKIDNDVQQQQVSIQQQLLKKEDKTQQPQQTDLQPDMPAININDIIQSQNINLFPANSPFQPIQPPIFNQQFQGSHMFNNPIMQPMPQQMLYFNPMGFQMHPQQQFLMVQQQYNFFLPPGFSQPSQPIPTENAQNTQNSQNNESFQFTPNSQTTQPNVNFFQNNIEYDDSQPLSQAIFNTPQNKMFTPPSPQNIGFNFNQNIHQSHDHQWQNRQYNQFNFPQPNYQRFKPDPITQSGEDFYDLLTKEILQLQTNIRSRLNDSEKERREAYNLILQLVQDTYQDSEVKLQIYGSMATGLAIDSSDMDILVSNFNLAEQPLDRESLIFEMKKLHKQLNTLFCLESNSIIETATIPVIKLVIDLQKIRHNNEQKGQYNPEISQDMKLLKLDITFNDQLSDQNQGNIYNGAGQMVHMGIICCEFIKQMLIDYPMLEPLTIVLKKFLAVNNLNSPFLGGLSSYGLIILIIAFLNNDFPQMYNYYGIPNLGRTLTHFLYFYSKCFETSTHYINESMMISPQFTYTSTLTIIDPLNSANNIGKSTYNFDQIKFEISQAYETLKQQQQQYQDKVLKQQPLLTELDLLSKIFKIPSLGINNNQIEKQSLNGQQNSLQSNDFDAKITKLN